MSNRVCKPESVPGKTYTLHRGNTFMYGYHPLNFSRHNKHSDVCTASFLLDKHLLSFTEDKMSVLDYASSCNKFETGSAERIVDVKSLLVFQNENLKGARAS